MALNCKINYTYKHITNMYESCLTISHVTQHYISRNTQKRVNINSYFRCGPFILIPAKEKMYMYIVIQILPKKL